MSKPKTSHDEKWHRVLMGEARGAGEIVVSSAAAKASTLRTVGLEERTLKLRGRAESVAALGDHSRRSGQPRCLCGSRLTGGGCREMIGRCRSS